MGLGNPDDATNSPNVLNLHIVVDTDACCWLKTVLLMCDNKCN
jgi:hypothetical protein